MIRRHIFLIIVVCSLFGSCKKSMPTTPTPTGQKGMVTAAVNLIDTFTGEILPSGIIAFTYGSQTVYGTPGQSVDIAEAALGTGINVKIVADSGNYLERRILTASMTQGVANTYTIDLIPITKTVQISGVLDSGPNYTFNLSDFLSQIVESGVVTRLKPPTDGTLNVYFNPDRRGTGKRLPDPLINELINAWEWMKNHSNGEITNIIYHRDGTKLESDAVSKGEIYVYESTTGGSASSIIKTNSDLSGYGIYLFFKSDNIGPGQYPMLWTESMDSMFANEINLSKAEWLPLFIMGFKRIAGQNNGYYIDGTHEEQILPDKYSGAIGTKGISRVHKDATADKGKSDNQVLNPSSPATILSRPRPQAIKR